MRAWIDAVSHVRKLGKEPPERFVAAAGKPLFLPDFVKTAWVTAVALNEIARPDFEPACDPNVDRVALREHGAVTAEVGYAICICYDTDLTLGDKVYLSGKTIAI